MRKVIVLLISIIFCSCSDNKQLTLKIWQTESDPEAIKVLERIRVDFEQKENVKVEILPNSWGVQAKKITKSLIDNSLPDIAHVQPFMVKSLVNKDKIIPLDDLLSQLEKINGQVYPIIKKVANHNGKIYGIPYAIGTTAWSYNNDQCIEDFNESKDWKDFIQKAQESKKENPSFNIMLPGASPFFMEQLYGELLANNGGSLFDKDGNPNFDSKENIETLAFLRELNTKGLLYSDWKNQSYLDQFSKLANGSTSCVLVTYARAANTITREMKETDNSVTASDSLFRWMNQPIGPSSTNEKSIATVDCEPWVIFSNNKPDQEKRIELSKKFLAFFYEKQNYIDFTSRVPIHLTPIFENFSQEEKYLNKVGNWKSWNKQTHNYLASVNNLECRPILIPDISEFGMSHGFLLELQNEGILISNILRALNETETSIQDIAKRMNDEMKNFMGYNESKR